MQDLLPHGSYWIWFNIWVYNLKHLRKFGSADLEIAISAQQNVSCHINTLQADDCLVYSSASEHLELTAAPVPEQLKRKNWSTVSQYKAWRQSEKEWIQLLGHNDNVYVALPLITLVAATLFSFSKTTTYPDYLPHAAPNPQTAKANSAAASHCDTVWKIKCID